MMLDRCRMQVKGLGQFNPGMNLRKGQGYEKGLRRGLVIVVRCDNDLVAGFTARGPCHYTQTQT